MALSDFVPLLNELRRRGKREALAAQQALETIIARGRAVADALEAVEVGAASVVAVPFAELLGTVGLIDAFIEEYFGDLDYPPDLFSTLRTASIALTSLQTLRRRFAGQQSATAGVRDGSPASTGPLIPYRLRQGDSIERMARDYLGAIERSWEILELNALRYPFLQTERTFTPPEYEWGDFAPGDYLTYPTPDRTGVAPGVLVTGEVIWLPPDARLPASGGAFTDRDVELYGRDLQLADGVLVLDGNGQLGTVEGRDNIIQALRHRIATLRGELLLHAEYGMEQLLAIGIEGTRTNALISGVEVARTVRQDPRVVQVRDLQILFADTINRASMRVGLIGAERRELPLNLVIPETAGATATG